MKKYRPTRYKEATPEVPVKKKNGWIYTVLIVFFALIFAVSLFFIVKDLLSENETSETINGVLSLKPVDKNGNGTNDGKTEENDPKAIYSLGDFSAFTSVNSDTVGWFYMPCNTSSRGLPIELPLLWKDLSDKNEQNFYLSHDFYGRKSDNGWVYISDACDGRDITKNRNLLIYGHARSYKMFGGLKNLNSDKAWQESADSHYIKISTPYEDSVWEIFSWHETTVYDNYWQTAFKNDAEFLEYANRVQSQDQLGCFTKFEFTKDDRIMTLSTCKTLNEDIRVAVHAKLIASVKRETTTE